MSVPLMAPQTRVAMMVGSVDGSEVSHRVRVGVLDALPMARTLMIRGCSWARAGRAEATSTNMISGRDLNAVFPRPFRS